jgi:hypothetical protein
MSEGKFSEVLDLIASLYSIDQILDILDIEGSDLVYILEERILDDLYKFTEVENLIDG